MKRFSKFMLSVAAVSAVTAAMAVSAMAADVTATYDTETDNGKVSITVPESTGASQTLLVLNEDVDVTAENADAVVAQINQVDAEEGDAEIKEFQLPAGIYAALAEGESKTYYIRIGGSKGTIQKGELKISKAGDTPVVELLVGDVDGDGIIDPGDASAVLKHDAGTVVLTGDALFRAAYCDGDDIADPADAARILKYDAGIKEGIGNVGTMMANPAE